MEKIMLGVLLALLFLGGCSEGKSEVTSEEARNEVKMLVEKNLRFSQEEDIEGYLSTIVERARESTKETLPDFFAKFDIEYELINFKVLEEEESKIITEAEQYASATYIEEGESFRDHLAVVVHTFVKEDGKWLISDSVVIDTKFR